MLVPADARPPRLERLVAQRQRPLHVTFIASLGTAYLLVSPYAKGKTVARVIFFMPYVLPGVAIGIVWGWIYDPVNGLLNQFLRNIGLGSLARGWLVAPPAQRTGDPVIVLS